MPPLLTGAAGDASARERLLRLMVLGSPAAGTPAVWGKDRVCRELADVTEAAKRLLPADRVEKFLSEYMESAGRAWPNRHGHHVRCPYQTSWDETYAYRRIQNLLAPKLRSLSCEQCTCAPRYGPAGDQPARCVQHKHKEDVAVDCGDSARRYAQKKAKSCLEKKQGATAAEVTRVWKAVMAHLE